MVRQDPWTEADDAGDGPAPATRYTQMFAGDALPDRAPAASLARAGMQPHPSRRLPGQ